MEMNEPLNPQNLPPTPPSSANPAPPTDPLRNVRPMSELERDLERERKRAEAAENLLRQQESLRGEADRQLKDILEQLKREKNEQDSEEEKSHARGRIDALEERLDEMHHTWSELLKEALAKGGSAASSPLSDSVFTEMQNFKNTLAHILPEIGRLGTAMTARIGETDRRIALEMEKFELKLGSLAQERAALQAAMEEERHRLRQEFAKERMADDAKAHSQWEEIRKTLAQVLSVQQAGTQDTASLREMTDKLQSTLNRPEKAKDLMTLDLEQEKRDLMAALKARAEELRAYTEERRDVERSMGESLLNLNRELEAERSKQLEFESQISDLRLQIQSRENQLDIARKSADEKELARQALAAERDDLGKALAEAIHKSKGQAVSAIQTDEAWQKQIEEIQRRLDTERNRRMETESQLADTRAKMQTLTDHIARTIQEKERIENQAAGWTQERETLLDTLRKKDEMISMLSATFQSLTKK